MIVGCGNQHAAARNVCSSDCWGWGSGGGSGGGGRAVVAVTSDVIAGLHLLLLKHALLLLLLLQQQGDFVMLLLDTQQLAAHPRHRIAELECGGGGGRRRMGGRGSSSSDSSHVGRVGLVLGHFADGGKNAAAALAGVVVCALVQLCDRPRRHCLPSE